MEPVDRAAGNEARELQRTTSELLSDLITLCVCDINNYYFYIHTYLLNYLLLVSLTVLRVQNHSDDQDSIYDFRM